MTEYSLKPGQIISFTGEAGSVKGVVRWNLPADEAYRVGVGSAEPHFSPSRVTHSPSIEYFLKF